jgi:hypothetical protein
MIPAYTRLLCLYPADVRFAHGKEMAADFAQSVSDARQRGRIALLIFVAGRILFLLCDASAERVNTLYSHRTFHGRCRPNPAMVRPPNMGKQEWFQIDAVDARPDQADH